MFYVCADHEVLSMHRELDGAKEELRVRGTQNQRRVYYVINTAGDIVASINTKASPEKPKGPSNTLISDQAIVAFLVSAAVTAIILHALFAK